MSSSVTEPISAQNPPPPSSRRWLLVLVSGLGVVGTAVGLFADLRGLLSDDPAPATCDQDPSYQEALEVWRGAVDAYNAGRADDYFGAYAETMACFYNASNHSRDALRASRLGGLQKPDRAVLTAEPRCEEAGPTRVILSDRGAFGGSQHLKVVQLQKQGQRWQITVEVGLKQHACFPYPTVFSAPR